MELNQKADMPKQKKSSLWSNWNFLYLWVGAIISNFGFQIYIIALPLLIYDLTNSAVAMSTMRAIEFIPNILFGMVLGVLVDRINRKKILSSSALIQAVLIISLVVLMSLSNLELWHLYIMGFILSTASYAFGNAHQAIIPNIIEKNYLIEANAKFSMVQTIIQLLGPSIAGFIITFYSYKLSFSVYAVCLVVLYIMVKLIKVNPSEPIPENTDNASIWEEMKQGLVELYNNKKLFVTTCAIISLNLASSLIIGILVFFVVDDLGASKSEIGFMFSFGAFGGLLASVLIKYVREKIGRGRIFVYGMLFDIVGVFLLIFANAWWHVGISLFIRTFGITMTNIVYFTIRQEFTPNNLLGRVAGTSSMMMKLVLPLGVTVAGIWVEFLSIRLLFVFSLIIVSITFLSLLKHPLKKMY